MPHRGLCQRLRLRLRLRLRPSPRSHPSPRSGQRSRHRRRFGPAPVPTPGTTTAADPLPHLPTATDPLPGRTTATDPMPGSAAAAIAPVPSPTAAASDPVVASPTALCDPPCGQAAGAHPARLAAFLPARLRALLPSRSPVNGRRLRFALTLLPLVLLAVWAAVDWRTVHEGAVRLASADLRWLLAGVFFTALCSVASACVRQGAVPERLPPGQLLATQFAAGAAGHALPGNIGAHAVVLRFLRRRGIPSPGPPRRSPCTRRSNRWPRPW